VIYSSLTLVLSLIISEIRSLSLKHSIENCSQTVEDGDMLLWKARRRSPAPYPLVPSPTPYDLPFSHNTLVMDGWTDRRHIVPKNATAVYMLF